MLNNILAKDNGETLMEHALKVKNHSLELKERHFNNSKDYGYLTNETIEMAALFHDIGKCTKYFQKRLREKGDQHENETDDSKTRNKIPHRHSEVSYAFLKAYTSLSEPVLKIIYWHHSITPNNYNINITDILGYLKPEDIETMLEFVRAINPSLIRKREMKQGTTPLFFNEGEGNACEDSEFICGLSCLLMGDRIASGMPDNDDLILNKQTKTTTYECPYPSDNKRTILQKELAEIKDDAFIINAPTGFGKTNIALQWALNNPRKTLVVCPMNNITKSVFKNLNKEIDDSKCNLTNSLVLANDVVDCHNISHFPGMMTTDIITMNIDSFLGGSYKYEGVWLLLNLLHSDVIFDEYHELFNESKIPAVFLRIMKARLWYTKSKTMFLSATPMDVGLYIDQEEEINIYPSRSHNYDQIHDIPYQVNFIDDNDINTSIVKDDSLVIYNSISDSQQHAIDSNLDFLSHSAFLESDKLDSIKKIYDDYGKESNHNLPKTGVVGTSVLRTSMNVSFNEITETIQSPIATLQTIGRCNRFSERQNPIYNITRGSGHSNNCTVNSMYNSKLKDLWYNILKKEFSEKGTFTLEELYKVYHYFNEKYYDAIDEYYSNLITNAERGVKWVFPKKPYKDNNAKSAEVKTDNGVLIAGSNPLRSSNARNEIFIVCRDENGEIITTPINKQFYPKPDQTEYDLFGYNSENDFLKSQKEFLGEVRAKGNTEYDFSFANPKKRKTISSKTYMNNATRSNSPIFVNNYIYNTRYGLMKK